MCLCSPRYLQVLLKHSRCLSNWRVCPPFYRHLKEAPDSGKQRQGQNIKPLLPWRLMEITPETSFSWRDICWVFFPMWWETDDLRCTVNLCLGVQCGMVKCEHSVVQQTSRTFFLHDGNSTSIEQQLPLSPSAPAPSKHHSTFCFHNCGYFSYIDLWWLRQWKHLPTMRDTRVQSLGGEDPLEKEMATHSSILAWKIPWREEPGGLQSVGHKESDMTEWLQFHLHTLQTYDCAVVVLLYLAYFT